MPKHCKNVHADAVTLLKEISYDTTLTQFEIQGRLFAGHFVFVTHLIFAKGKQMTSRVYKVNYRTIFPLQKVSFLAAKIPVGRKSFLSLSARKKRKRYRRKKCPMIKKFRKSSHCMELCPKRQKWTPISGQ